MCEVKIQREENAECDVTCGLRYQSNQLEIFVWGELETELY